MAFHGQLLLSEIYPKSTGTSQTGHPEFLPRHRIDFHLQPHRAHQLPSRGRPRLFQGRAGTPRRRHARTDTRSNRQGHRLPDGKPVRGIRAERHGKQPARGHQPVAQRPHRHPQAVERTPGSRHQQNHGRGQKTFRTIPGMQGLSVHPAGDSRPGLFRRFRDAAGSQGRRHLRQPGAGRRHLIILCLASQGARRAVVIPPSRDSTTLF